MDTHHANGRVVRIVEETQFLDLNPPPVDWEAKVVVILAFQPFPRFALLVDPLSAIDMLAHHACSLPEGKLLQLKMYSLRRFLVSLL